MASISLVRERLPQDLRAQTRGARLSDIMPMTRATFEILEAASKSCVIGASEAILARDVPRALKGLPLAFETALRTQSAWRSGSHDGGVTDRVRTALEDPPAGISRARVVEMTEGLAAIFDRGRHFNDHYVAAGLRWGLRQAGIQTDDGEKLKKLERLWKRTDRLYNWMWAFPLRPLRDAIAAQRMIDEIGFRQRLARCLTADAARRSLT